MQMQRCVLPTEKILKYFFSTTVISDTLPPCDWLTYNNRVQTKFTDDIAMVSDLPMKKIAATIVFINTLLLLHPTMVVFIFKAAVCQQMALAFTLLFWCNFNYTSYPFDYLIDFYI